MSLIFKSIKEVDSEMKKHWEDLKVKKGILFSMIDGPADENAVIKAAEDITEQLKARMDAYTERERNTFIGKLGLLVKRSKTSGPIERRLKLSKEIEDQGDFYNRKSRSVRETLGKFGFDQSSKELPDSLSDPCFSWSLNIRKMDIANVRDVWQHMRYNPQSMASWWWNGPAPYSELSTSDGWSDYKRLARRIVFQVLEVMQMKSIQEFRHFLHLKLAGERIREIVLYQVTACYKFPSEWIKFKDILEHTIPVVYLVTEVFRSAQVQDLSPLQNDRIEDILSILEPYLRELRDKCYILGNDLGYSASELFKSNDVSNGGKLFDFGEKPLDPPNHPIQLTGITVDSRLAGKSAEEFKRIADQIDQKQAMVNRIVENPYQYEITDLSNALPITTERLDMSVLRKRGVNELKNIIYEGRELVGSGGYADVYKMDQVSGSSRVPVAVKRFRPDTRSAKRIEREASVWLKLRHKHVLPLLGFTVFEHQEYQPCLVSRLCYTDLKRFLAIRRNAAQTDPSQALTEDRKFEFLRDIILGLDYLHALGIAHGDLRAANILITNGMVNDKSCYAILNDFGMAEYAEPGVRSALDCADLSSVNQKTNDRWLAPELFKSPPRAESLAKVSLKGDVYAFGVVYLEVIYEMDPYVDTQLDIGFAKSEGKLPVTEEQLQPPSEAHWSIMNGCWEKEEDKRWTMPMAGAMVLTLMFKNIAAQSNEEWVSDDLPGLPEGFTQYTM